MDWVFPQHLLGRLDRRDIEIDDHRLLAGTHQNAFQRFVPTGVNFLVWDVGWHIDEIARARLGGEFELLAPSHPRPALDDEDNAFEVAMVMGASLGVGMDR